MKRLCYHYNKQVTGGYEGDRFWSENITGCTKELSLFGMKCQSFLECVFFLFVNCLSGFFGGIAALSVEGRCHIMPARDTGNFDIICNRIWQPAQIHILVQLCLAGASVHQRCLLPDEIPSVPKQPLSGICISTNRVALLTNIGKTVFITTRKTRILEPWHFIAEDNPLRISVI